MSSIFAMNLPKVSLEEIEQKIEQIRGRLETETSKVLTFSGDISSKFFFLGEAAGPNDARNGQIFSGPYSQIFNQELLPSISLNRQNIYLTNLVKNSQPFGHTPSKEEINLWKEIAILEIALIQPKLIVTLGKFAMEFFVPKAKISDLHGRLFKVAIFEDFETNILFLLHPANAHRFPEQKTGIEKDFEKIKLFLDKKINPQTLPMQFLPPNKQSQDLFE